MLDQSNGINCLNKILQEIVFKQLCQLLNFMDFALFHFPYPELPFCKLYCDLSFSEVKIHLPFKRKKKKQNQSKQTNRQKTPTKQTKTNHNFFFFWKCWTYILVSTFLIFAPRYLPSLLKSKSAFCSFWNLQIVGICHVL